MYLERQHRYWNNYLEDYCINTGPVPCAGGLLAAKAIGAQLGDLIKLGTDPMAVGGINTWTPPRKSGGIP